MQVWNRVFIRPSMYDRKLVDAQNISMEGLRCIGYSGEVVFKRQDCEWLLPLSVVKHIKFNPRHLPVVQVPVTNEDHYLRMAIRRYLKGWRAWTPVELLPKVNWK